MTIQRFAIRNTAGEFLTQTGGLTLSVQDGRIFYRKADAKNALRVAYRRHAFAHQHDWKGVEEAMKDWDVVGVIIRTKSEWDLMEERLKEDSVIVTQQTINEMRERLEWLDALEDAGVDNWSGISFAYETLRETKEARGEEVET